MKDDCIFRKIANGMVPAAKVLSLAGNIGKFMKEGLDCAGVNLVSHGMREDLRW